MLHFLSAPQKQEPDFWRQVLKGRFVRKADLHAECPKFLCPPFGPNDQGFTGQFKADYRPRTLFSVLSPSDPLAIALPAFDIDLVIATQCPVESQPFGLVQELREAADLIVVTPARKELQLAFECRQPGSLGW